MIFFNKKLYSLLLILHLCASVFFTHADIVQKKNISSITEYVDENNKELLVILDLDNTTLRPTDLNKASDEWFCAASKYFVDQGLSSSAAIEKILPLYFKLQESAVVQPVEPEIVTLLQKFQNKGIPIIALTARSLEIEACTINQLKSIDIDFSVTSPQIKKGKDFSNLAKPVRYSKGIMFCSGNSKGKTLLSLFEATDFWPNKVIFVDDKMKYLESVEKELAEAGINDFIGIRYGFLDEQVKNFKLDVNEFLQQMESVERQQSFVGKIEQAISRCIAYVKSFFISAASVTSK